MLPRRPAVDVIARRRSGGRPPARGEVADHLVGVDALLQAQVDGRVGLGVEEVVALVLGVVHPEAVLDVLGAGDAPGSERLPPPMVSRKSNRIGNSAPKRACTVLAQQRAGAGTARRRAPGAPRRVAEVEQQAVLLGHAVEAPAVVDGSSSRSQTSFIHWPPHGAGSKKGTGLHGPGRLGPARRARRRPGPAWARRGRWCRGRSRPARRRPACAGRRPASRRTRPACTARTSGRVRLSAPRLEISSRRKRWTSSRRARSA